MGSLWSAKAVRPAADVKMLTELGFNDIKTVHGLKKRTLFGLQYLKYGFWSDFFLVAGTKIV